MTITAWRIDKTIYAERDEDINGRSIPSSFSGTGARLYGGRWNSIGSSVVYTAGSQSLAILEILVHLQSEKALSLYSLIAISFEEEQVLNLHKNSLPKGWDNFEANTGSKFLGDNWIKAKERPVLEVPSVIVPDEKNYLINPLHPDFNSLVIGTPVHYPLDPRLFKTL